MELTPESLEKAKRELNEDPDKREASIQELRESISAALVSSPDCPAVRVDEDAFLLRFLRAKKFRQKDALEKYLKFCKFVAKHPEIFDGLNYARVSHIFERNQFGVLEHRLKNGTRLLLFFPGRYDFDSDNINEALGAVYLTLDKLLEDPENQVNGFIILRDWDGIGFTDLVRLQGLARREAAKFTSLFQVRTLELCNT